MKFRLSLKDPDGFYESIKSHAQQVVDSQVFETQREVDIEEDKLRGTLYSKMEEIFGSVEDVVLEVDLDTKEVKVLK